MAVPGFVFFDSSWLRFYFRINRTPRRVNGTLMFWGIDSHDALRYNAVVTQCVITKMWTQERRDVLKIEE